MWSHWFILLIVRGSYSVRTCRIKDSLIYKIVPDFLAQIKILGPIMGVIFQNGFQSLTIEIWMYLGPENINPGVIWNMLPREHNPGTGFESQLWCHQNSLSPPPGNTISWRCQRPNRALKALKEHFYHIRSCSYHIWKSQLTSRENEWTERDLANPLVDSVLLNGALILSTQSPVKGVTV